MSSNSIPDMTFFTDARMQEFWGLVKALLLSVSPMVMISVALIAVGMLLTIIVNSFKQARSKDDDDDSDYEIKHY